jgi:hypothetical protein
MKAARTIVKQKMRPMGLKDYGRNSANRKESVHQEGLSLVGIDIGKAKHDACTGTLSAVIRRRLTFSASRKGFVLSEKNTLRQRHRGISDFVRPQVIFLSK